MQTGLQKFLGICVLSAMGLMAGCGQHSAPTLKLNAGHVVGGTAVSATEFKNVVGLVENGRIFCSGNVIEAQKILTAGHCVTNFDITTQADLETLFNATMTEIERSLAGQDISVFNSAPLETKRGMFKAALRRVIRTKAKDIRVYVGTSTPGGGIEAGLDAVADMELSDGGYEYMEASVLKYTNLKVAADEAVEYSSSFDHAVLILKAPLAGVTPVPVISAEEHQANVVLGQDVRVVGFGLKVDIRFVTAARDNVAQLRAKIAAETDATKKADLQRQLTAEQQAYASFLALYLTSGNKNMVDMKLENYDQGEITLKRKGSNLQGACNGDSGGAGFVKLKNGEWRQLGVTVTVDYCGNKTSLSPQFRK